MSAGSALQDERYLRERRSPQPGDPLYLHLADLQLALAGAARDLAPGALLDLGSGGAPYRALFGDARYACADLAGTPGVDYVLDAEGRCDAPLGAFDVVLSTQVLEHVPDPGAYLRLCLALLRPGGALLLSTHGLFEEHACPGDYRRWTAEGLRRELAQAGFEVRRVSKLSTEGRALAFFLRTRLQALTGGRKDAWGLVFRALHRLLVRASGAFDRWCDLRLGDCRVVDATAPGHAFYVALLAEARRP